MEFGLSYSGGKITFEPAGGEGTTGMSATVTRSGANLSMSGVLTSAGKGWTMTSVFKLTKPAE
jgi:hypothetical protein